MTLGPISHVEIATWAQLMRLRITPAEVELIREIDLEFRNYIAEKYAPPRAPTLSEKLSEIADQQDAKRLLEEQRKAQREKKEKAAQHG